MQIIPIRAFTDNYIWLLVAENSRSALCVDPGEARPLIDYLNAHLLSLENILLTHHHYDHVNGVAELLNEYPHLEIYGPSDSRLPYTSIQHVKEFSVHHFHFQVLEIPGHTSTHVAYFEPNYHLLFSGDTLFSAGCGRVFDGSLELLYQSLNRLKNLPDNTMIYCGHEYTTKNLCFAQLVEPHNPAIREHLEKIQSLPCSLPSTIQLEKQINPFFRLNEYSVQDYAAKLGSPVDPFSVFKQLRRDKDQY